MTIPDPLTKIEGVPSRDQAIPGMAYFAGTGPDGKTCKDCEHRGYYRQSEKWSEERNCWVTNSYRVQKCAQFKSMTGRHGADVAADCRACKYFQQKSKDNR